jgi:hypothetical protein
MTTESQEKLHRQEEKQKRKQVKLVISNQIIEALGQPGDLHKVQVRPLWEDHYRINVFVGVDAASLKLAHSYFLVADDDGKIIASTPPLLAKKAKQ